MRDFIDGDDMFLDIESEIPEVLHFYIPEATLHSENSEQEIADMVMLMMMPTSPTVH